MNARIIPVGFLFDFPVGLAVRIHVVMAALLVLLFPTISLAGEPVSLQTSAELLYKSLTPEQRKEATLPFDSPERLKEVFPGGPRAGIQLKNLTADQRGIALMLLKTFVSDYGNKKIDQISDQKPNIPDPTTGFERYYLCFFGEPGEGKTYAWRIAEHHLTIVHVEVEKGQPISFGPILLGANPPTIWDEEEDKLIVLYGAMTPDERTKASRQGQGISTVALDGRGISVGDLNPSAKEAAKAMLENRVAFFSTPIRERLQTIIASQGGLDAMQIAFWGTADKRCRDGGKWDFKLAGPAFLCDYENTRGHIHLSMKGKLAQTK